VHRLPRQQQLQPDQRRLRDVPHERLQHGNVTRKPRHRPFPDYM